MWESFESNVPVCNLGGEEAEEEEEDDATEAENSKMEPVVRAPQMSHILEKFRHRSDKMNVRETFPLLDKVIERFSNGRKGGLISEKFFCRFFPFWPGPK